jgi:HSP20 family protein
MWRYTERKRSRDERVMNMVSRLPSLSDEFVSLRDVMDRFFNEGANTPGRGLWSSPWGNGAARMALPLDVYGTKDEVVIIAVVPGIQADELEISINQNTVTLSGKMPNVASSIEGKEATWYLHELPHGAFQRSITLPIEVDAAKAEATSENGILRLRLPKAETAKPHQIKVRGGSQAIDAGSSTND